MTTRELLTISEQHKAAFESTWSEWLGTLESWEFHWLCPRELELHDAVEAGQMTLLDIEALLETARRQYARR